MADDVGFRSSRWRSQRGRKRSAEDQHLSIWRERGVDGEAERRRRIARWACYAKQDVVGGHVRQKEGRDLESADVEKK